MADKDGGEMLSITTLHTDRLIGTSLSAEDFDDLCNMHQEPRVMATLGGLRSAEQTQRLLRENLDHRKSTATVSGYFDNSQIGDSSATVVYEISRSEGKTKS